MTGRANQREAIVSITAQHGVDDIDEAAGGQFGGVKAVRRNVRVRIQTSAAQGADGVQAFDVLIGMDLEDGVHGRGIRGHVDQRVENAVALEQRPDRFEAAIVLGVAFEAVLAVERVVCDCCPLHASRSLTNVLVESGSKMAYAVLVRPIAAGAGRATRRNHVKL